MSYIASKGQSGSKTSSFLSHCVDPCKSHIVLNPLDTPIMLGQELGEGTEERQNRHHILGHLRSGHQRLVLLKGIFLELVSDPHKGHWWLHNSSGSYRVLVSKMATTGNPLAGLDIWYVLKKLYLGLL